MSDTANKFRALVEKLYVGTGNGAIIWSFDELDRSIISSVGDFTVKLSAARTSDGEPIEKVDILDDSEETIDSFSDTNISGKAPNIVGFNHFYELMKELRNQARRQATGADRALDSILKALEK